MYRLTIILLFITTTITGQASGQTLEPQTINAGFDPLAQGFYLGFDHRIGNYTAGLDIGSSFGVVLPKNFYTLTFDNNFYFGALNDFSKKTWYLNTRLIASKIIDTKTSEPFKLGIAPGIGKNLTLNYHWSLNLGVGVQIPVYIPQPEYTYIPGGQHQNYAFENVPTLSLRVELKHW